MENELAIAVREEREAERRLQECRRRVDELAGIVPPDRQRKLKARKPDDFARACGV